MTTVAEPPAPAPVPAPSTSAPAKQAELVERSIIDASTRGPVLAFFGTATLWLLLASLLGLIASIKLHSPGFLADWSVLTYGRVYPAFQNAFLFGWGCLVGMGVAIWLMARLCRVALRAPGVLLYGVLFWNVGVAAGVGSILLGNGRGIEGMEMPVFAHVLMFLGFVMIGLWGAVLYRHRKEAVAFISVWYVLGALFWLPWLFATANILVSLPQVRGVMQPIVGAWFANGLNGWWFTAIGLAAAYFLIPKVVDRPVYSYNLATIGFWSFAFISGLTALTRLSGGPVPVWAVTVSIAASIMMVIPVTTVLVNLLLTLKGSYNSAFHSPTIRFTLVGVAAFGVASLLGIITSLRSVDSVLHFTQFGHGLQMVLLYSFFSMVMFGAIYYITPRLVGCEWLSSTMISLHFWSAAYGGSILAALILFSGVVQGLGLKDVNDTFAVVVQMTTNYFPGRTLAFLVFAFGHIVFAFHLLLMLLRIGQPGGEPTLFAPQDEEAAH